MLFILHGPDSYRAHKKLKEIKDKFTKDVDPSRLNLVVLEKDKANHANIKKELTASPFLARKRMVVIKNAFEKKIPDEVAELILAQAETHDSSILVVYQESNLPASFIKSLSDKAIIQPYSELETNEVAGFIIQEVRLRGGKISNGIANALAIRCGSDLWLASAEIDKLIALADGQEISLEHLRTLTEAVLEDNIFNLIDSLVEKNISKSLSLLEQQFLSDAEPLYLHTMIVRQFRIMIQIRDLLDSNPRVTESEVAKNLAIHPYAAKKSLSQSRAFSISLLEEIYQHLLEMDIKLKNNIISQELTLDYFVVKNKAL